LASICLIFHWWGIQLKTGIVLITFSSVLGWTPVIQDLWYGQLNTYLLLLLLCARFALRDGKYIVGGAILGGMIALKLAAWPLVLFLAYRRKWSGVLAAAALVLAAQLLAIIVLGLTVVKDYYFKIGPAVASFYRAYEYNISIWTLGRRLFGEYGHKIVTIPRWPSPFLADLLTYVVPSVLLIFGLALAVRAKQFDTSFGILVIVGVLINPVAWIHYLLLAAIPIVIIARRIVLMEARRKMAYTAFVICLLMSTSPGVCVSAAKSFSTQTTPSGFAIVPHWAGALMLIPVVAALGMIILLWKTDRAPLPRVEESSQP
jgi:Glycosyltransferase family 87